MELINQDLISTDKGQATTEYILLIAAILSFYLSVSAGMERLGVMQKINEVLIGSFAAAYQYGHPKAKGFDNGGPVLHPRVDTSGNFRIFIQPENR